MPTYKILPLTYQSSDIPFAEWISLFTLCLAPLVIHVASGAPHTSYLDPRRRPQWHDRICHFNPTSIIWRYAAITDRRLRALIWRPEDMVAANAIFWTRTGWDGGEAVAISSASYVTHLPEHARVDLASRAMIKTVVITLQGCQAVYLVAGGVNKISGFNRYMGLDGLFTPIAILGLLRLCAAPWLTDDFAFTPKYPIISGGASKLQERRQISVDSLLDADTVACAQQERFRPTIYWPSILFRSVYISPLLGLWVLVGCYVVPWDGSDSVFVTTTFLTGWFYQLSLTITIPLYAYYFFNGGIRSTIIPCMSSLWYKVYTVVVYVCICIIILFACIETRRTPCGTYTTRPGEIGNQLACGLTNSGQ